MILRELQSLLVTVAAPEVWTVCQSIGADRLLIRRLTEDPDTEAASMAFLRILVTKNLDPAIPEVWDFAEFSPADLAVMIRYAAAFSHVLESTIDACTAGAYGQLELPFDFET